MAGSFRLAKDIYLYGDFNGEFEFKHLSFVSEFNLDSVLTACTPLSILARNIAILSWIKLKDDYSIIERALKRFIWQTLSRNIVHH